MLAGGVSGALSTIPIPGMSAAASAIIMGGVGNVAGGLIKGDITSKMYLKLLPLAALQVGLAMEQVREFSVLLIKYGAK